MKKVLLTALSLTIAASCAHAQGMMDSFVIPDSVTYATSYAPKAPVTMEDIMQEQLKANLPRSGSSNDLSESMRQEKEFRSTWYGAMAHKVTSFFSYVFSCFSW